jgi:hypothetical protein
MATNATIETCYKKIEFTLSDKNRGGLRAQKLLELCEKYSVNLDDVKIEQHKDYRWGYNGKNRFQIGGSNNRGGRAIVKFWAVLPMDAVMAVEYASEQKTTAQKIRGYFYEVAELVSYQLENINGRTA